MNPETRAVVDAVREALDIPHAATVRGNEARQKILSERTTELVVVMTYLSRDPGADIPSQLAYLRERLAERPPVGYVTIDQALERRRQGASWMESVALPAENAGE